MFNTLIAARAPCEFLRGVVPQSPREPLFHQPCAQRFSLAGVPLTPCKIRLFTNQGVYGDPLAAALRSASHPPPRRFAVPFRGPSRPQSLHVEVTGLD